MIFDISFDLVIFIYKQKCKSAWCYKKEAFVIMSFTVFLLSSKQSLVFEEFGEFPLKKSV